MKTKIVEIFDLEIGDYVIHPDSKYNKQIGVVDVIKRTWLHNHLVIKIMYFSADQLWGGGTYTKRCSYINDMLHEKIKKIIIEKGDE